MKFATLQVLDERVFAIVDAGAQRYWPVADCLPGFSGDPIDLIRGYDQLRSQLKTAGDGKPLAEAKVLAPLSNPPRNIFCVGKNYHEHAAEFAKSGFDSSAKDGEHAPEAPVVFTKAATTIIGPGARVPSHPALTQQLDYEAELAVVIGKKGIRISRENAYDHVFGYTIVNDFTARDLQKLHRQWFLGKSLDGFCPMGPYLVTADEVDLDSMRVQCHVNGELRQDALVSQLIFDIPTIIATISAGIELQPGDIIATGTPAGVGIGFNPPRFIRAGDVMRIEITGLGILENEVE
jgi:2-keto-4-pentenoate hydratase/2-oxohepta-3-ene-1,7-dioic acid hydratase in catechol pathway